MIFGPGFGTDAPSWYIGRDGKIHPVPGWNPEAFADLSRMVIAIGELGRIKNHGLVESTLHAGLLEHAFKELGTHVKEGGVLVLR
jgi:hypothetical protein